MFFAHALYVLNSCSIADNFILELSMENMSRSNKRLDFLLPETQADGLGNYESLFKKPVCNRAFAKAFPPTRSDWPMLHRSRS
jgi:hypothetical protein